MMMQERMSKVAPIHVSSREKNWDTGLQAHAVLLACLRVCAYVSVSVRGGSDGRRMGSVMSGGLTQVAEIQRFP